MNNRCGKGTQQDHVSNKRLPGVPLSHRPRTTGLHYRRLTPLLITTASQPAVFVASPNAAIDAGTGFSDPGVTRDDSGDEIRKMPA